METGCGCLSLDESSFMFRAEGRFGIYRRHDERYAASRVTEPDRLGGGSVTVWAGIHHDGRTV